MTFKDPLELTEKWSVFSGDRQVASKALTREKFKGILELSPEGNGPQRPKSHMGIFLNVLKCPKQQNTEMI